MNKLFFILLLSLATMTTRANDTLHVSHYNIHIDTINYKTKTLKAHTRLTALCKKQGVQQIRLSLQNMNVSQVLLQYHGGNTNPASFQYKSPNLLVQVPSLAASDSIDIEVYYDGKPYADPTFGGFTFSGNYAFNIGVGFQANPHNLGKVWFPCIDEFTDRATYEFHIRTAAGFKAFCNGLLQSVVPQADGTQIWNWQMKETIPTYLAGMAVCNFKTLTKTYKNIPVEWAINPNDSAATMTTFAKFDTAMSAFVKAYGAYPWEKVGFIMVPFNGGAMEHATSIHVGRVFIDGTLSYETLWPHELSHMWWGDKVTCETAGDMWLNEGWASFNEYLFTEAAYGRQKYQDLFRQEHRNVLQFAHINDGAYLPLINVPHAATYGTTVYKKGAGVVHTLRNYLGDDAFFKACKDYLNQYAYRNANSYQMRDAFAQSSGKNLTNFFDDWVFTAGSPHFAIDSFAVKSVQGGQYETQIYVRQKQKGNTHLYHIPIHCTLTDGLKDTTVLLPVDAATNQFQVRTSFVPKWLGIDRQDWMADAQIDKEYKITTPGTYSYSEANANVKVSSVAQPATLRVIHHYVAPDPTKKLKGYRISTYHYWSIEGLVDQGLKGQVTFSYDGSTSTSTGYLDNDLIKVNEDSLVLLYRPNVASDWRVLTTAVLNKGNNTDKRGSLIADSLLLGEYALGVNNNLSDIKGLNTKLQQDVYLATSPNPILRNEICRISLNLGYHSNGVLSIFDLNGKQVWATEVFNHQDSINWDTYNLPSGSYIVVLKTAQGATKQQQVVVQ